MSLAPVGTYKYSTEKEIGEKNELPFVEQLLNTKPQHLGVSSLPFITPKFYLLLHICHALLSPNHLNQILRDNPDSALAPDHTFN